MNLRASLWLAVILFTACVSQKKIIFIPDPVQNNSPEQTGSLASWQIIESQSGLGETGIPAWVRCYLNGGARETEGLDAYSGKYVFIGKNRGDNFNALQQWANAFSAAQDLPGLVVRRVEQRLIATAVLYPDDEYGEYFAQVIKSVSDEEYPGAIKEQIFWTRQQKILPAAENNADSGVETPPENTAPDKYEFLVLISTDKEAFKMKINKIMTDIKTTAPPTKDQTAAINKMRQTFFEGF